MDDVAVMLPTPAEPPNGEYALREFGPGDRQLLVQFPNRYGASIVQGHMSYGHREGLYELAVTHGDAGDLSKGQRAGICYATPITSDVLGWLTPEDVVITLHVIVKLPPNDDCDHRDPSDA